jgi:hypothetical protein
MFKLISHAGDLVSGREGRESYAKGAKKKYQKIQN